MGQQKTVLLAIFRDQRKAAAYCLTWMAAAFDRCVVSQPDGPAVRAIGAEDGAQEFRAARPYQAGDSQSFPTLHFQAYIADLIAAAEVLDAESNPILPMGLERL
jgi:hypothetical protein